MVFSYGAGDSTSSVSGREGDRLKDAVEELEDKIGLEVDEGEVWEERGTHGEA